MKRSNRYLVLGLGFLIFLILGPILVFFVSGVNYNFEEERYQKTGALSVKTDPKDAKVYLDNVLADTTPAKFRFLEPRTYNVRVEKEGYYSWSKNLLIESAKAVIASSLLDSIKLIKQSQPTFFYDKIQDFVIKGDSLLYIQNNQLKVKPQTNNPITIAQTSAVSSLQPSGNDNYVNLYFDKSYPEKVYDIQNGVLIDYSQYIKELGIKAQDEVVIDISSSGIIYSYFQNNLYTLVKNKMVKSLSGVIAFTEKDDRFYFVTTENGKQTLKTASITKEGLQSIETLKQEINRDLTNAEIYITNNKEVLFIFKTSDYYSLYRLNNELRLISENITDIFIKRTDQTILYTTEGALWRYEPTDDTSYLITRQGSDFLSPIIDEDLGYSFYGSFNQLIALELDNRDKQNQYVLATTPVDVKKIQYSEDTGNIYYLNKNGQLSSLAIR